MEDNIKQWTDEPMVTENTEVVVSNVGMVYLGFSITKGMREFKDCVEFSKSNYGRMAGEDVTLFVDNEIEMEYTGTLSMMESTDE